MSTAAHLYPVPDPDDETPGEGPALVELPTATEEAVEAAAVDVQEDPEEEPSTEAGDELEDEAEEPGEEDTPRRAFALPDLRPYVTVDRDTVKELGSLAAEATRTTAPRIGRRLAPLVYGMCRMLRAGTLVLLLLARGWFTGEVGPKVSPLVRLLVVPGLTLYALTHTLAVLPLAPFALLTAWPLAAVIAERWAALQVARAAKAKASAKGGKGSAKEVSKEPGKGAPRTFTARLAAALAEPAAVSPERLAKASAESSVKEPGGEAAEAGEELEEEAGEELEETAVHEAPAAPSRDDIVRALHALVGDSSGTLDTALRDRLRYPSTRAVREALEAAGIPHRDGVRAVGGNGPGVHRRDFPPLPPSREGAPGPGVVAGQDANNNANNAGEGPGEGLGVEGSDHDGRYPFNVIPDPERGPSAWKIVHPD